MKCLVFLALLFLSATCQDVSTTSESTVTLPSVPSTDELVGTTPMSTVHAVENNIAQVIPPEIEEDKYHSCTACPFESDHHKCNDPFKLSKSFEVSADMCNKINTDKRQVDILCKRYPKGYFFQCPKGGSSYTCKASCGVRVEDVGKGLLDADIKDMPGGLLSGLGFNNNKMNSAPSQHQPQGIDLLNTMGDIFHSVHQPGPPHVPVPTNHLHAPGQQHPNQMHPNNFAGPHNVYPGPNPLFQQHQNMFQNQNTPLMMPFHHPNNNPFVSQVPVHPHHHVFPGFTGFSTPDQNAQHPANFPHPPSASPKVTMPVPPSPKENIKAPAEAAPHGFGGFTAFPKQNSQPHTNFPHPPPAKVTIPVPPSPKENIKVPTVPAHRAFGGLNGLPTQNQNLHLRANLPHPAPASPKAIMSAPPSPKAADKDSTAPVLPTVVSNPVKTDSLTTGNQVDNPKVQPAAVQTNNVPKNPSQVAQTKKAVQDINNAVNQHKATGNDGMDKPQNTNNFGFGLFGQHPNQRSPFQHHANFFQDPMHSLHNFGQPRFMNKPVQGSASKATQNLHSFMGGFDDFNNGFHQFASGIGPSSPKKANPVQNNGGSFFNSLFSFKKR